jgi:hypothetical protein
MFGLRFCISFCSWPWAKLGACERSRRGPVLARAPSTWQSPPQQAGRPVDVGSRKHRLRVTRDAL